MNVSTSLPKQQSRARNYLAPGSQNWHNFPVTAGAPRFFVRSKGPYIEDASGNRFIDLYSGSGTVILGHADDYQLDKVRDVLSTGPTVSLRHPVEADLAERLVEQSPGAAYCHFFKTGSEAVHAAVRICINLSARRSIATTTYHGWLLPFGPRRKVEADSSSKMRLTGQELNQLDWSSPTLVEDFEKCAASCACLIITPTAYTPNDGRAVRELVGVARRHNVLVVFDEVKAAYRYAYPNATAVWGISPDLRIVSKSLANGFAVSALLGTEELLGADCTLSIFSTYASELISLTAAMACLDRLADGAYESFVANSRKLKAGLEEVGGAFGIRTIGRDSFFRLALPDEFDADKLCGILARKGIFYHPHDEVLIGASHTDGVVEEVVGKFAEALDEI